MTIFHGFACLAAISCGTIQDLTLEEKVGQLLMVHFNGVDANNDARTLIQTIHVGGIIYYNWANGLDSPEQVRTLSSGLQQLALSDQKKIPLLIAVDQEGGLVARLNRGFTIFPGNGALGAAGDPQMAEDEALAIGEELAAVGINMNLAPVADIADQDNSVIGIRSFGRSAQLVADFARKALVGYHRAGMITSLKHFPGYGDACLDPHEDLPSVDKSMEELGRNELLPFSQLCNESDTVMTAHIMVPAIDREHCATLSEKTLSLLRNDFHFQGVIISDSLMMEGVLKQCGSSVEEVAIRAFNAGCDILLLGGRRLQGAKAGFELGVKDVQRIHHALIEAVRSGRISEEKVDQSVSRILRIKERCKLFSENLMPMKSEEHRKLARKIAAQSIRVIQNNAISDISNLHVALVAPEILHGPISQTSLTTLGKKQFYFQSLNPTADECAAAENWAGDADVVIFCSYNAWKNASQEALLARLSRLKPTVLIALRDEKDARLYPGLPMIISTLSPTAPSIQAASDCIFTTSSTLEAVR